MGANCSCQKDPAAAENEAQVTVNQKHYLSGPVSANPGNEFQVQLDQPFFKQDKKTSDSNSYVYNSLVGSERRIYAADSQLNGLKDRVQTSSRELATYEGEMTDGLPDGKGKEIYKNGDEYVGQFLRGKKHGYGILYSPGKFRYCGNFLNNKMNGNGVIEYENGAVYKGEFKNGLYDGKGTFTDQNKTEKSGAWSEGNFVG